MISRPLILSVYIRKASADAFPSPSTSVQFDDDASDPTDWEDIRGKLYFLTAIHVLTDSKNVSGIHIPRAPSLKAPVILKPTVDENNLNLQVDDIKTEYHDRSGLPCTIQR